MRTTKPDALTSRTPSSLSGSSWLGEVREVRLPIDLSHPLRVNDRRETAGEKLPRPTIPYPERHPYCEFNFQMEGRGDQFIGTEQVRRSAGDMMLIGPGTPHYGTLAVPSMRIIVVHFLPILLIEMGPNGDGARMLARFTGSRTIAERVVRPPKKLRDQFAEQFEQMAREFSGRELGSELAVRARLMDALVTLLRWEESVGHKLPPVADTSNWVQIEKVLQFIGQHYAEPLYIENIAASVGLGPARLHALFRDAFGMSCLQYLRAYRVSHAASLLCLPEARVTEIAFAVGFESLSHFNASFRHFQGMSPRDYIRMHRKQPASVTADNGFSSRRPES
jgi:AraC-like DNA-binding protein